ncbi:L,D-transpeptidase family protein, partial [Caulobacter sp. 17J65-9]|uniref:L,D-transpeptidase family protein n=1 Tax=Caulobacter sp. 17J65-9 TaxID=2709382 RepID=UPI001F09A309
GKPVVPTARPAATTPQMVVPQAPPAPPAPLPRTAVDAYLPAVPAEVAADVRRFYVARKDKTAWNKTSEAELLAVLNEAQKHGLDPKSYVPVLGKTRDLDRDARLTGAALLYAKTLALGRVDPSTVENLWELRRNSLDGATGLQNALNGTGVRAWLDSLAPSDLGYTNLSAGYLKYRDLAAKGGWPKFEPGAVIRPGDADPRLPALVARLVAEGDLADTLEVETYDPALVEAVQRFQVRHGLGGDGVIGGDTQSALAATAEDRARQIALNLERRRWLPRQLAPERIEVNTAAAIMVYWRDGAPYHASRVVVGTSRNQTPSLEKEFSSLVANPPWNVPAGIAAKEILPKGPGYLAAENMYVTDDGRVVQRPGPNAALGQVKFELQDSYAIYLHDTPSKPAFASPKRHRSHGCVRVENAVEFARLLLEPDPTALQQFDELQTSGETKRVQLSRSIPVRLLYWTTFVDGQGRVAFRPDVYGRDAKLAQALGIDVYLPGGTTVQDPTDVGP